MATGSNRCSICKNDAQNNCTGCLQFFCVKDYRKHRQQLSMDFDSHVVRNHDELLQQIHQIPNNSADDLFSQVDQWETTTIDKIRKVAQNVREKLNRLITLERETLTKQFESITKVVRHRRQEEDFDENNIEQLQRQIHELKLSVEQFNQPNSNNFIVVENDEINWTQIIRIQSESNITFSQIVFHTDHKFHRSL